MSKSVSIEHKHTAQELKYMKNAIADNMSMLAALKEDNFLWEKGSKDGIEYRTDGSIIFNDYRKGLIIFWFYSVLYNIEVMTFVSADKKMLMLPFYPNHSIISTPSYSGYAIEYTDTVAKVRYIQHKSPFIDLDEYPNDPKFNVMASLHSHPHNHVSVDQIKPSGHSGDNDFPKVYNKDLSLGRGILMHIGNTGENTEGCLLPGSGLSTTTVDNKKYVNKVINSTPVFYQLIDYIEKKELRILKS